VRTLGRSFEVLLAANGCTDMTMTIAEELMAEFPELLLLDCPEPNYGAALRLGIESARGDIVLCDEIDLCDVDFYRRALRHLDRGEVDFVVGSKALPGSRDRRPFTRRMATRVINTMLRTLLDFHGTDTHGLKAFRRQVVMPIVERCVIDKDLFASELVIRAGASGVLVHEIPIELEEHREPSIRLIKRVPRVLKDMGKLVYAIRFKE